MKHLLPIVLATLVLGATAYIVASRYLNDASLPEGLIQANGRIEGDHVTVTTKFPGRIIELHVHEGDEVDVGQVIATLDDTQLQAQVEQARQATRSLDSRVQAAEIALAVLEKEVPLTIVAAEADVRHAQAVIAQARLTEREKRRDFERVQKSYDANAANEIELDHARTAWEVTESELVVVQAVLEQAQSDLAVAGLGNDRIEVRRAEIQALKAQRDEALAAQSEAESILNDLTIRSPGRGTITTRLVNLGETLPAGAPLFDLVDLDALYLKVYVPEIEIGKIRLDLPAQVYVDAFPDTAFPATVRYIASRAEFTPKEVQTPDERVKLVFAVKVYLDQNPDHRLAPGMPADAVVKWNEDVPWSPPHR